MSAGRCCALGWRRRASFGRRRRRQRYAIAGERVPDLRARRVDEVAAAQGRVTSHFGPGPCRERERSHLFIGVELCLGEDQPAQRTTEDVDPEWRDC